MKHYSLKIRGVVFVPVLGAAVVSQEVFPSKKVETIVAACGPLFGLCNATLILGLWVVTQVPLLFAIATFTMSLNLFNLIPLPILDGGIIAKNLFWTGEQPLGLRKLGAVLYVFGFSVIIEGFIFMPQLDRLVLGCSEAWKLFW